MRRAPGRSIAIAAFLAVWAVAGAAAQPDAPLRPRILLSDDDGISAAGLAALYPELARLGEVTVAAPAENQSGVGHGITYAEPIFVREIDPPSRPDTPAHSHEPHAWERTWDTFHTQSLLGAALLAQQKYAEAEPPLVQGYQGMTRAEEDLGHNSRAFVNRKPRIETLERLVQVYEATNQPDEAAKWRKELDKAKEKP